jgi:hypothetical protein
MGSDSTGLAEATRPFTSAIPLIPTVNSVRRCGSWRVAPYLALVRARCLSTTVVKLSTCQPVKVSSLILMSCSWRSLARLPPALLFGGRKDPRS